MRITILYNAVREDGPADELDVLNQRDSVAKSLSALGHETGFLPLSLDLAGAAADLKLKNPALVFNLAESVDKSGRLIYFAPAVLEHLQIPFTGSGSEAMFLTTNKLLTKERLQLAGLPTPEWLRNSDHKTNETGDKETLYIVKPVWEDASVGIDGRAALCSYDKARQCLKEKANTTQVCFAEQYIEGREFNLSILAAPSGPEVLPAAEIEFIDYPADRPMIVDYKAKWETGSFEYTHTVRRLDFPPADRELIEQMRMMALQCWHLFDLHGYARVDFRVDQQGRPWILEINANPCISPDSGFVAAAEKANLTFDQVIKRIIGDVPAVAGRMS